MKQPQYSPLSVAEQALTLFAVNNGYYDGLPVEKALAFETELRAFMKRKYASLMEKIESNKDLDEAGEKALRAAIEEFRKTTALLEEAKPAAGGAPPPAAAPEKKSA
jgi:F-type H+-transporting ATPase subunit alpha